MLRHTRPPLQIQTRAPISVSATGVSELPKALLLELGASAQLITSRYDGTVPVAARPRQHLHWTTLIVATVLGDGGLRQIVLARSRGYAEDVRQL